MGELELPSYFEEYAEKKEKVRAFQFEGPHQVDDVLKAFGESTKTFTLRSRDGEFSLSFPRKVKAVKAQPSSSGIVGTITLQPLLGASTSYLDNPESGWVTLNEGWWVVVRWADTHHSETQIMSDQQFSRSYR